MNELVAYCIVSIIWGFVLWASGSCIKDIMENRLIKFSGIGFFMQIVGCIFMVAPFVIVIIGFSAFVITGIASTISVLI